MQECKAIRKKLYKSKCNNKSQIYATCVKGSKQNRLENNLRHDKWKKTLKFVIISLNKKVFSNTYFIKQKLTGQRKV